MQKDKRRQDSRLKTQDPRQTILVIGLGFLVFGLLLAGCAKEQQYGAVKPICVETRQRRVLIQTQRCWVDKLQAMEVAEDILVKMHFTIEKADANPATLGTNTRRWRGFIRTRPLPGAQFFEFWRSDNVGAGNWLESNLHSIRRVVELNMSEQDEGLCINCDVQIYRLSLPERRVSSSARAYDMFSASSPALQRIQLNPKQKEDMAGIDLGKDTQLAAEILKRISSMLDIENRESRIE